MLNAVRITEYYYITSASWKRTVGTLTPLRALRHLVKDIGGATSFIPMEWEISYSSSFYRHPERICVEQ